MPPYPDQQAFKNDSFVQISFNQPQAGDKRNFSTAFFGEQNQCDSNLVTLNMSRPQQLFDN